MKNCFIRGSVVRYVQLPADAVDTQLLEDATRRGLGLCYLWFSGFLITIDIYRGPQPNQTVKLPRTARRPQEIASFRSAVIPVLRFFHGPNTNCVFKGVNNRDYNYIQRAGLKRLYTRNVQNVIYEKSKAGKGR